MHEEDGTLTCRVIIPLTCTPMTSSYTVTLRQDETPCRYEEAIRAACIWWERRYPPMPIPADARLPMYSTWYSLHQGVFTEEVLTQCARAKALGMDIRWCERRRRGALRSLSMRRRMWSRWTMTAGRSSCSTQTEERAWPCAAWCI